MLYKNCIVQHMGKIFCVEFQRVHKISYQYIERCAFYSQLKIQELLDLRAHKPFWNAAQRNYSLPIYHLLSSSPHNRQSSVNGSCLPLTSYIIQLQLIIQIFHNIPTESHHNKVYLELLLSIHTLYSSEMPLCHVVGDLADHHATEVAIYIIYQPIYVSCNHNCQTTMPLCNVVGDLADHRATEVAI